MPSHSYPSAIALEERGEPLHRELCQDVGDVEHEVGAYPRLVFPAEDCQARGERIQGHNFGPRNLWSGSRVRWWKSFCSEQLEYLPYMYLRKVKVMGLNWSC